MRASLPLRRLGTTLSLPPSNQKWPAFGPFIYINHHVDHYPAGQANFGPAPNLLGNRILGNDFHNPSGWSMYMGTSVPGFPAHPHKGMETLTLLRKGTIDHADSTGAGARYGAGDVQWVTAGKGVRHSEMFPLLKRDEGNTVDMYQFWVNLPAKDKGAEPEFVMMWDEDVPVVRSGKPDQEARVTVVAGRYGDAVPLSPPKASWAADEANDLAVWFVELDPGAEVDLPPTNGPNTERRLYVHGEVGDGVGSGGGVRVRISGGGETVEVGEESAFVPDEPGQPLRITNGDKPARVLVLQAVEIGEPVAIRGPFVMNTEEENLDGFAEYRKSKFGKWTWGSEAPTWGQEERFALKGGEKVFPEGAAK